MTADITRHHGFPNDDIVTTLRTMVQFTNSVAGGVCWRAADEIDRLREQVERWIQVALKFNHADNQQNKMMFKEAKQLFADAMQKDMGEE